MRRRLPAVVVLLFCAAAMGQDQPKPEELQKLYTDAIAQLKAAQDRKNELAAENEKLAGRIAAIEKQLAEREKLIASFEEKTWNLRSFYASWQSFIQRYPRLSEEWKAFLSRPELDGNNPMPAWEELTASAPSRKHGDSIPVGAPVPDLPARSE